MTLTEFQSKIKYNTEFLDAFLASCDIDDIEKAYKKAEQVYYRRLSSPKKREVPAVTITKKGTLKKKKTPAQKKGYLVLKDRMQMAKNDMIHHIEVLIKSGELSYREFTADPTVHFDSQIMGVYYHNYIIRKAIIRYFEKEFIPF